jgi:hypothetical protein
MFPAALVVAYGQQNLITAPKEDFSHHPKNHHSRIDKVPFGHKKAPKWSGKSTKMVGEKHQKWAEEVQK